MAGFRIVQNFMNHILKLGKLASNFNRVHMGAFLSLSGDIGGFDLMDYVFKSFINFVA